MTDASDVATPKEDALHKAFKDQTEAEFIDCWIEAASQGLEADLRRYNKKQPPQPQELS